MYLPCKHPNILILLSIKNTFQVLLSTLKYQIKLVQGIILIYTLYAHIYLYRDTLFDQSFVLDEMISKFMALKEKNKKVALIVSAPVKPEDVPKVFIFFS